MKRTENSWKKSYWLIVTALISIAGFIITILYGHKFDFKIISGLGFIMVLSLPFCIQILYFDFVANKWYEKLVNLLIGLIWIIPAVLGLIWCKDEYDKIQLEKYPKIAYGQINDYETTYGKSGTRHYAIFQYEVNGEQFQQSVGNNDSFYKLNDSLKLLVSEKDPEIVRIIGYKRQ